MKPVMEVSGISKSFGGLKAVQSVDLSASAGKILSIIGPNGAGKTTLFNCLTGIYRPDTGSIFLEGREITGTQPHEVCRLGIARTFQNIRLFGEMTALENVMVGHFHHDEISLWHILSHSPAHRILCGRNKEAASALLARVGLEGAGDLPAQSLAYGLQKRLEIARALATQPKILLLDEPGAGMNPQELGGLIDLIGRLKKDGLAIVLIEHHMQVVMEISDDILVLDHGEQIAHGIPRDIRNNPRVIEAYLGKSSSAGQ